MAIKKILFSIPIFAATTALSIENVNLVKPIVFTLDKKTASTHPDDYILVFKKAPGSKYNFELIKPDKVDQYVGKPCVVCPFIDSIIVNSDNPDQCDPLAILTLSARLAALEEHNKIMVNIIQDQKEINERQTKIHLGQHEINERQTKINLGQNGINERQNKINEHQDIFNQTVIDILKKSNEITNQSA